MFDSMHFNMSLLLTVLALVMNRRSVGFKDKVVPVLFL